MVRTPNFRVQLRAAVALSLKTSCTEPRALLRRLKNAHALEGAWAVRPYGCAPRDGTEALPALLMLLLLLLMLAADACHSKIARRKASRPVAAPAAVATAAAEVEAEAAKPAPVTVI